VKKERERENKKKESKVKQALFSGGYQWEKETEWRR
jgi:hypothetical protein